MGSPLNGITTACVLFLFACQIYPTVIKNRTQYYAAFGCVLAIIFVNTFALMIGSDKFNVFAGVIEGFLQLVSVTMLVLCAGGKSIKTLAGELGDAYEVIRRGEETKEVIIPLTGAMPGTKKEAEPLPKIEIDEP